MKILTYHNGGGAPRLGALAGGEHVIDLTAVVPDAMALLEGGERAADAARKHVADTDPGTWGALNEVTPCAPVPRPNSIRETMTFEAHIINVIRMRLGPLARLDGRLARIVGTRRSIARLLNRCFYDRPPYYKANRCSVVGHDAEVRIPSYIEQFDYELELGVFIGKQGTDIPAERAREHIACYTLFNDFSARDIQAREIGGRMGPAKGKNDPPWRRAHAIQARDPRRAAAGGVPLSVRSPDVHPAPRHRSDRLRRGRRP